ncbi:MFS transporter [Dasania marina]|uniref:MFS transporter n=1 Tax=Dasania marina TaxID=471499 RepID=UPI00036AE135|nr:MFS transporter [Dasania marina]
MTNVNTQKNTNSISHLLPDNWGLLLAAFAAAYGIGLIALFSLPFLIGAAMTSLSISAVQAAFLGTAEFLGVMAASMCIAPFMDRVNRKKVAYSGVFIALCANIACVLLPHYDVIVMLRPIAGIGVGLVMACGNATVSHSSNPERFAAHMTVLSVALMIVVMLIFSRISDAWGLPGIYAAISVIILIMSLLLTHMPSHAVQEPLQDDGKASGDSNIKGIMSFTSLLMLATFLVFSLRDTMAWAFLERIGSEVGYSVEEVGNVLSAQAFVGIFGPIIASIVGSRFGIKLPLAIGILVSGTVTYIVSQSSHSQFIYTAAVMFMPGSYFFTLAYLTALAAELDVKGRVVAASGSALMAGIAIGPILGGTLIDISGNYSLVGWATLGCIILTSLFVIPPLLSVTKKTTT